MAAAADLGARVTEELGSLAMLGASLEVRVTPRDKADDPLGPYGRDDIAFLFTPFEGSPQLPMGKALPGGELSRLMLALELVAADTRGGADQTFIFDEVDAGVGGKAAVELEQTSGTAWPAARRSSSSPTWRRSPRGRTRSSWSPRSRRMPMTTIWAWSPPSPKSTAKPASTKSPACSPAAIRSLPWTRPRTPIRFSTYAPAGGSWRRRRLRWLKKMEISKWTKAAIFDLDGTPPRLHGESGTKSTSTS